MTTRSDFILNSSAEVQRFRANDFRVGFSASQSAEAKAKSATTVLRSFGTDSRRIGTKKRAPGSRLRPRRKVSALYDCLQNLKFNPNCITRGRRVEVTRPNWAFTWLPAGSKRALLSTP